MVDAKIVLAFNSVGQAAIDTLKAELRPQNGFVRGDSIRGQSSAVLSLWIDERIQ